MARHTQTPPHAPLGVCGWFGVLGAGLGLSAFLLVALFAAPLYERMKNLESKSERLGDMLVDSDAKQWDELLRLSQKH